MREVPFGVTDSAWNLHCGSASFPGPCGAASAQLLQILHTAGSGVSFLAFSWLQNDHSHI